MPSHSALDLLLYFFSLTPIRPPCIFETYNWAAGIVARSGKVTAMEKVFHFDSAADPYVADAAVLCCFDQRIRLAVYKFLQKRGILRPDMIIVAGGAKTLASPRNDFERDFILEQVRMSILLHSTERISLMSHSDCATYGGLAAFGGDPEKEALHHKQELHRAAQLIQDKFPEVRVECFFVTFKGIFAALEQGVDQVA